MCNSNTEMYLKNCPQHSNWFSFRDIERCKVINVLNVLKDKNHMVISIDAEMTFEKKNQHAFIIKVL